MSDITEMVLDRVREERKRQDDQWGGPTHDDTLTDPIWLMVLTRHFGRVGGLMLTTYNRVQLSYCLVRVAAIAVAWAEVIYRRSRDS